MFSQHFHIKNQVLQRILASMFALLLTSTSYGQTADSDESASEGELTLLNALLQGRLSFQLRPRYTLISETNKPEDVDVWTVRTVIGWRTAPYKDFRLTAEAIDTEIIGPRRLNSDSALAGSSRFPLLPDPAHHGINQLFLDYDGLEDTRIRTGRQILRLDQQRMIGDIDFRQTPQLFDGVTLTNTGLAGTEMMLGRYHHIRNQLGRVLDTKLTVAHVAHNPAPNHILAAYGIWQDQANTGSSTGFGNNSNRIVGIRAEGSVLWHDISWLYSLELAQQRQFAGGDARIKSRYSRWGGGFALRQFGARYDYEIKGSNQGVYGFQTPLTDFYAYNGWALKYITTPATGLRDAWITVRASVDKLDFYTEYHTFHSDTGRVRLSHEWDASLAYNFSEDLLLKLQIARYRFDAGSVSKIDSDKNWLALTYKY